MQAPRACLYIELLHVEAFIFIRKCSFCARQSVNLKLVVIVEPCCRLIHSGIFWLFFQINFFISFKWNTNQYTYQSEWVHMSNYTCLTLVVLLIIPSCVEKLCLIGMLILHMLALTKSITCLHLNLVIWKSGSWCTILKCIMLFHTKAKILGMLN